MVDIPEVERRYADLSRSLRPVRLHYAVKCNPDPHILRALADLGSRFEIASVAELRLLSAIGVPARELLFSNPVRSPQEIRLAYAAGVRLFSFDSEAELVKLAAEAPGASVYVRLRTLQPGSQVPSEGKFGIDPAVAIHLMLQARRLGLVPHGLTFHVGSQMLDPSAWQLAIAESAGVMRELLRAGIRISMLDIGGGFPATYDEVVPGEPEIGAAIAATCRELLPYPVELVAEPGRALVASCGAMVASVIGVARRGATSWVHLDVGAFNGFMEALETRNTLRFPMIGPAGEHMLWNVTGPSCDSQDTICFDVALSRNLSVGDRIHIYAAGAYTLAYASNFNGFDIPATHYTPARITIPAPSRHAELVS